jgi:peptidoglycan/xylan/chitin deacetylase (PgdA/CDA1 family)
MPSLLERQTKATGHDWRQRARTMLAAALPRHRLLVRGPATSSAVALTFDDGPDPEHTPRLLDLLKEHGARATFFVVGQNVERYPGLVRRMIDEGHAVGHHSFSHADPRQISAGQLRDEVRRTQDLLVRLVGKPSYLFRPPHGKVTVRKLWSLWWAGQTVVLWNVDSKDYACGSSDELVDWFTDLRLHGGDILLMHDNRPHAGYALPTLLRSLREQGLRAETVIDWAR